MKNFYLSLAAGLLSLCAISLSSAQTISIGNLNNGNNRAPYGCYNGYEYTEYKFLGTELTTTGNIMRIGFMSNGNGGNLPITPVTIKMANIASNANLSSTTYAAALASGTGLTTVFSGVLSTTNMTTAAGYVYVTLSTPFNFVPNSGANNLLVFVETSFGGTGGADSVSTSFRFTTATNKCQRWVSDNVAPTGSGNISSKRTNIQFIYGTAACSGTPAPGATLFTKNPGNTGVCSGSPFMLYVNTYTTGSGVSYQWQSSADGTTYVNATGSSTNPTYTATETAATFYKCKVTCGISTATSTVVQVPVNLGACYCPVYFNGDPDACGFGDEIAEVLLWTLDNTSDCSTAWGYGNNTAVTAPTLNKNGQYNLIVTVGSDPLQYQGVWIDYNQSGTFEPGEFIGASGNAGVDGKSYFNFTVPSGALTGTTRMRIKGGSDSPVTSADACGRQSSKVGEIEDYNIIIQAAPACSGAPVAGTAIPNIPTTCSGGTVNIFLNGQSTDAGVTYQWQSQTDSLNGNYVDIPGATSTLITTSPILATTYFRCVVKCTNTNDSSFTNQLTIVMTPPPVGGTATGPALSPPGVVTYTIAGQTGNIDWEYGFSPTGPFYDSHATDTIQGLPFGTSGVYYIRNRSNSPQCTDAYSNVVKTIVAVQDDDPCLPAALIYGTNGPYSNTTATSQYGEVHPFGGSCNSQSSWCSTDSLVQNSRWFSFVAPNSGKVEIKALGFNTQLAVWSATSCEFYNTYTLISANDDGGGSPNLGAIDTASCLTPGVTYLVQMDGFNGATGSTTVILTALTNSPPQFSNCPSNIAVNTAPGTCSATASWTPPTATDDCSGLTVTSNKTPGASFNTGNTTVIYTATDGSGATSTCTFTVTVTDNQAPSITCAGNITVSPNSVGCQACGVTLTTPTTSDNCGIASTTSNAPSCFNLGLTNVIWTATDVNGNTATCVQTVTVADNQAPTISCPSNITVNPNSVGCQACSVSLGTPTTSDNCTVSSVTNNAPSCFNPGITTVIWTATDNSGNTATCSQLVTVADNQAPVITCPATANITANAGLCTSNTSIGTATATDNCSTPTITRSPLGPYSVGTTTVIWTATDANGNSSTCAQLVNVTDNQAPVITCPATANITTNAGLCNSNSSIGTATATDNCSGATISHLPLGPYSVGSTTVIWTATDASGNTATCAQIVNVTDNQVPVITCPATANIFTDAGICTSTQSIGTATATDNCSGATVSHSPLAPYSIGAHTIVWTATDASGNTSTCAQIVNVTDNQVPVITCPATANIAADLGLCTSSASIGTATATDNCGVPTISHLPLGPYSVGPHSIIWTATDASGNTATCVQIVNVTDNQPPVVNCPPSVTVAANASQCFATGVSLGIISATDNCGLQSSSNNAPSQFNVGSTTVIWTVLDVNGNTATCAQIVNVSDNQNPVITCPATANLFADLGLCTSSASIGTATATDNCSGATVSHLPLGPYTVGSTTVIWTATDASGNTATCTQIVNVSDNQVPVITCPATANIAADLGLCTSSTSIGTATATDNCSGATVTHLPLGPYSVGSTTVIWTATDASGNTATCAQIVNVADNQAPVITCPATANIAADLGLCTSSASIGTATATDNCSGATVSHLPLGPYSVGSTTVIWTATDASGNTATCSQIVNVTDNQVPVITCPATANIAADLGLCTSSASIGTATATDNCSGATVSHLPLGPYSVGSTTVIWTATDASGNTATCAQIVNVTDNQVPVITCPATANIAADLGLCTSSTSIGTATATDNCSGATVTHLPLGPYSVGSTTVIWTATDASGNTATCAQIVNVTDNQVPVITCPATANLFADLGLCTSSASIGTATATDNCSGATVSHLPLGPYSVGPHTIIWTATDASGNTATCAQIVNVSDNQNPVITCPATANLFADLGLCTSSASIGTATATDNCSGATVTHLPLGPYSVGSTTVIWTATDASGNTATCTQIVNVSDNQNPVITCPATANLFADLGLCTSSASIGTATATDNCSGATVSHLPLGPYTVGSTTVIWTATDASGNTATCSQIVNVTDNQVPVITCPATANIAADLGLCTSSTSIGTATATDNCSGATVSHLPLGPYSVGSTTVIWTATDANGNTATCTQIVNVTDGQLPTISCPGSLSAVCSPSEQPVYASLTQFLNAGGAVGDNCGINAASFIMVSEVWNGQSCPALYTRTYRIADNSGNLASCAQTISVYDNIAPVALCKNITVTLSNGGLASIAAADVNNGSLDNCGISSMVISTTNFNCSNIGANLVTLTVTDNCGNTSTCSSVVTIQSGILVSTTVSNISCGTGFGSATANASGGNGVYTYAWSNSQTNQTATGLTSGIYTVTVTDGNGCTKTATAQITVTIAVAVNCSSSNATCFGFNNGSATAVASAGSPPYSYLWSNGNTNSFASGLVAGVYIITVTDNSGCTATCSATVGQPSQIVISNVVTDVACKSGSDGSINITVSGGTGTYSYNWSNSSTSEDVSNLVAGTYVVTVTDNSGCSVISSIVVNQPATLLVINFSKTNVRCGGTNKGSATATPTGGVPGYFYQWSTGETTATISNLFAGNYTVTVTDSHGCVKIKSVNITQNPSMVLIAAPSGSNQGTASVSGGVGPYIYFWNTSPAQTLATATGLTPGSTYKIKVTDSKGCTKINLVNMPLPKNENNMGSSSMLNVSVYPNPTDGKIRIDFENKENQNCLISVYSNEGKLVLKENRSLLNNGVDLDFSYLPKGIYLLRIESNNRYKLVKMVLQ